MTFVRIANDIKELIEAEEALAELGKQVVVKSNVVYDGDKKHNVVEYAIYFLGEDK